MLSILLHNLADYALLLWQACRPRGLALLRAMVLLAILPLFIVMQLPRWTGLLLDEVLFPGYRRVPVNSPVFSLETSASPAIIELVFIQ